MDDIDPEALRAAIKALARMGGKARQASMSAAERTELGKHGMRIRWGKKLPPPKTEIGN